MVGPHVNCNAGQTIIELRIHLVSERRRNMPAETRQNQINTQLDAPGHDAIRQRQLFLEPVSRQSDLALLAALCVESIKRRPCSEISHAEPGQKSGAGKVRAKLLVAEVVLLPELVLNQLSGHIIELPQSTRTAKEKGTKPR